MFKFQKAKKAMQYYNIVMVDAEKLKGYFYETDIYTKYKMAPDLAMVPRLSLVLCAAYDGCLRLKWGAETTFEIFGAFISALAEKLPDGKYKNNPEELFKFFLRIYAEVCNI